MVSVRRGLGLALLVLTAILVAAWWNGLEPTMTPQDIQTRSVRLRRPAVAPITRPRAPSPAPMPAGPDVTETEPVEAPMPVAGVGEAEAQRPVPRPQLGDLPQEEREVIVEYGLARIAELGDACAHLVGEEGARIQARITLDARGLLEMELSAYDGDEETTWATDEVLDEAVLSCLDDTIWEQDWPTVTEGVQFAITLNW